MIRKLFYEDTNIHEWESEITQTIEKENEFYVTLSETAFYPGGGGQPADFGTIDGIEVMRIVEENELTYYILGSKPRMGKVICSLNFERRFDLMQQHTGQHLFSAIFYNKYQGETSSFHLGVDYVSVDISIPNITPSMAREVENIANDYIFKNLNIITHVLTKGDTIKFPLRKLPPSDDEIRIVEIENIDYSPCCGTHVSKTGEIGIIKIIKTEKYKGVTRIYLKCGRRALLDYQSKTELVMNLGKHYSLPENEILPRINADCNEIKLLTKQLNDANEKVFQYEAKNIISNLSSKLIFNSNILMSISDLQLLSKQILLAGDYVVIFGSSVDNKIFLAHNGNFNFDFGKFLKENLSKFNGKGGGSPKQAQAGFDNIESMISFMEFIHKTIESSLITDLKN